MAHEKAIKILNKHMSNGTEKESLIKWWNRLIGYAEERNFGVVAFTTTTVGNKEQTTCIRF